MGKQRREWTQEQKLTIVLSALRDEQSIAALSRQYGVNENLIHKWNSFLMVGAVPWVVPKSAVRTNACRLKTISSKSFWVKRVWRSTS